MTFIVDGTSGLTFPNSTVQVVAAQTGPAFSAYLNSNQSITAGTGTKILFDTEDFDTNNNFASSRFTPTVAGYYQLNCGVSVTYASGTVTRVILQIYKNGISWTLPQDLATVVVRTSGSILIYLNGSTDYVEIYGWIFGVTSPAFEAGRTTFFSGSLARVA
jgi:hypothetical protein